MTNVAINFSCQMNQKFNSAYNAILHTGGLNSRSMRLRGTVAKAFVLLDGSSNVIRFSTLDSKSAGLRYFRNFSIHVRYFVIINVINLFFF